jgi:catechol 2,3-dioxygenase-like lactoylglutathione lyase family enzyme
MKVGAPRPSELDAFYREIGLEGGNGSWGTADRPGQIAITESPYRQLRELRVACRQERELAEIAARLERLGVSSTTRNGELRVTDPLNHWDIVVQPAPELDLPAPPRRLCNRPGERPRRGIRAEVTTEAEPRPPRRLGHVVIGTPEIEKTRQLFVDGLGFRPSDSVAGIAYFLRFIGTPEIEKTRQLFVDGLGFRPSDSVAGIAYFLRCSPDHHNFLIQPGPVPYLNHYAFEHDDIDALARAASLYVRAHPDAQVDGPGRHVIGSNVFWYMRDPSGTFFEFFTDMDAIPDDEAWEARDDWPLEGTWSSWGSAEPPEVFFQPDDIDDIVAGYHRENS